jgi:hypothetical protein
MYQPPSDVPVIDRRAPLALLMLLVACGSSSETNSLAEAATVDTLPNGAVRVINHGPAEWADTNGWKLVLERTIQPASGTPGELLQPRGIAIRADGHLLVGDGPPAQAKLFGPDGEFIRTIGREGDGPGEYRSVNPAWMGDTVAVQDNRRGTTFTITGEPIATFQAVCCVGGPPVKIDDRNRIRMTGSGVHAPGRFTSRWTWFSVAGERLDSLDVPSAGDGPTWSIDQGGGGVATYSVPFAGYSMAETLRDGRIIYGFTSNYSLLLSSNGTDTVAVFGRDDATPMPIPDSIRQASFEQMTSRDSYVSGAKLEEIPTTFPLWRELDQDGDGNIWVGRPGPNGMSAFYDVFTLDGGLRGSVAMPWTMAWQTSWGGDRVAVLDIDENDLPRIRVYRIQR